MDPGLLGRGLLLYEGLCTLPVMRGLPILFTGTLGTRIHFVAERDNYCAVATFSV